MGPPAPKARNNSGVRIFFPDIRRILEGNALDPISRMFAEEIALFSGGGMVDGHSSLEMGSRPF